jgi:hypothetical protein
MDKKIIINGPKKNRWPGTPRLKKDLTPAIIFLKKSKMVTGKSKEVFFCHKNLFSSFF